MWIFRQRINLVEGYETNDLFRFLLRVLLFFVSLSIFSSEITSAIQCRRNQRRVYNGNIHKRDWTPRLKIPRGKIAGLSLVSLLPSLRLHLHTWKRTGRSHDAKVAEVSRVYRFENGVKGSLGWMQTRLSTLHEKVLRHDYMKYAWGPRMGERERKGERRRPRSQKGIACIRCSNDGEETKTRSESKRREEKRRRRRGGGEGENETGKYQKKEKG